MLLPMPDSLSPPAPLNAQTIRILGCPLECGLGVRGTGMGPAAFRTAGLIEALRDLGHEVRDHGDVPTPHVEAAEASLPGTRNFPEVRAWSRRLADAAFDLAQAGGVPVFLGGDHALAFGTVAGIARHCRARGRELAVLWVDAHADFNAPHSSPSGNMHGMPTAFLTGDPSLQALFDPGEFVPLPYEALHLFGLRSVDREERRRLAATGIHCTEMRSLDEVGVAAPLRALLATLAARPNVHLHVSFDADLLDPTLAPGVGVAVPGGATTREAHLIMELLHESGLVGSVDVVELNPFLDERGRTARLLTELLASLFGRVVLDRPAARTLAVDTGTTP